VLRSDVRNNSLNRFSSLLPVGFAVYDRDLELLEMDTRAQCLPVLSFVVEALDCSLQFPSRAASWAAVSTCCAHTRIPVHEVCAVPMRLW
jgi:hypothetical protein